MGLENIVQGHGDVILRGEIDAAVKENLNYLTVLKKSVKAIAKRKNALELLDTITIEDCGKSRVYLGGLAQGLHERNLRALLRQMSG
jgi:cyclase